MTLTADLGLASAQGNGLNLRYRRLGPRDVRTPVVYLHGIGGSSADWLEVASALDHPGVALDARGHGESDWSPTAEYSTDAHFADLACAMDALGIERCVLAGYSMGGGVAMLAAHALGERVERLVIVDTYPAPEMTAGSQQIAYWLADGPPTRAGRPAFDPAISEAFRRDLAGGVGRMDLWPHWDALECPVLLVRGGGSRVLPPELALEMIARQPLARLVTIEGATHGLLRHAPDSLAAAMCAFLEE
ncbi:MAG: alpha/beta hydrolase [Dehalococcoidia bacterium]